MVFAMIAIVTTLTYITYSMNTLDRFNQVIMVQNEENIDQLNEEFAIVDVRISSDDKFNIVVQNTGNIPINLQRLWITYPNNSDDEDEKYDINEMITPGGTAYDVGGSLALLTYDPAKSYSMKLITERGNTKEFLINSIGDEAIYMQLHATPHLVPQKFTTTITLEVVNNMSNNGMLLNIQPKMTDVIGTVNYEKVLGPMPEIYPTLRTGDVATFKWVYSLDGLDDDSLLFNATLENARQGNYVDTTAKVKDILSALSAGSSISALGIDTPNFIGDRLIFHEETADTPDPSKYQMSHAGPDGAGGGESIDFEGNTDGYSWFTQIVTQDIEIYSGSWYGNFRYFSDPLPPSLMVEPHTDDMMVDMIFHFEDNADIYDSTSNTGGLVKNGNPIQVSDGPWTGSNYYILNGIDDRFDSAGVVDMHNNIKKAPDTTALWFRTDTKTSDEREVLLRIDEGDVGYTADYYTIMMNDGTPSSNRGKIIFEYDTAEGSSTTTCISNNKLDDNLWHHAIAVRPQDDHCKLYIDGQLNDQQTPNYPNSESVDTDSTWHVGSNGIVGTEYYKGDIDAIFHWNDRALSDQEVLDLYNQNYGKAASIFHIAINRTDSFGNDPLSSTPVIIDSIDSKLPFIDPKGNNISLGPQPTPWFDTDWQFRKKITIDKTKVIDGPHTNFPVLISISSDSDLAAKAQSDGADIVITLKDGQTKLDHEIEKFDGSTGKLVLWVEVPNLLSSSDTVLYMYYGNDETGDQQNVAGTWNSNYMMVQHLNEENAKKNGYLDSTSNNNDGQGGGGSGGKVPKDVAGKIGVAQDFDGKKHYIDIADSSSLHQNDFTLETWFNGDNVASGSHLMGKQMGGGNFNSYIFYFATTGSMRFHSAPSGGGWCCPTDAPGISSGSWYHVAVTKSGTTIKMYLNDIEVASTSNNPTALGFDANSLLLGADNNAGGTMFWDGKIDEVRLSDIARSAGWLNTEFNNQNSPSTFFTSGVEETEDDGGGSSGAIDPSDDTLYPLQDPLPYSVILGDKEIKAGERMKFFMNYTGGLDINLRFDDMSMGVDSSGLQFQAPPDPPFPSYFTYSTSETLKVTISNDGPYGVWLTSPGTRVVFDNPIENFTSYGAIICSVNSTHWFDPGFECGNITSHTESNKNTDVDELRDSTYIPVDNVAVLYFHSPPKDRPDAKVVPFGSGNIEIIETGNYRTYLYINGYDETGRPFIRQLDLGLVNVKNDS